MELWIGALNLGLLYALMAMGIYITFRIHDFADITVDGSFTSGAAVAAIIIVSGGNPLIALVGAFGVGLLAGAATALIHTKLNINSLLAGILVMTGLYSINLHIMGRSNIPLLAQTTVFSQITHFNPGLPPEIWYTIVLAICVTLGWLLVSLFFKTDLGIAMRVTGNNPIMAGAVGQNVKYLTLLGVALANGLVGLSGSLVAQYQGFADIGMGIGTVLIGLASVIIGESILKSRSVYLQFLSVVIGSVVFRFMIAFALFIGMNPIDLKLLTALFVLLTLIISKAIANKSATRVRHRLNLKNIFQTKTSRWIFGGLTAVILIIAGILLINSNPNHPKIKIGVVQFTDNSLLDVTRDSFVKELQNLGYVDGKNYQIILENAHGDAPTINTIIDKFLRDDVNLILTISTSATQAAINKVKDRPVVFATVANPFIIGAGQNDSLHLANVTGVYGAVPMDKTLEMVNLFFPDQLKIGCLWDPSQANVIFNVNNLKNALTKYPQYRFEGANASGSAEVYQAALSLVNKGIDVFVLPPDNIIYSAFDAVVKAAQVRKIPIFLSDVERLADGALLALGYDYSSSGIQAAHIVDRVIKGANPAQIPFEIYKKLTIGLNKNVAREIGLKIPTAVLERATLIIGENEPTGSASVPKTLALFQFSSHSMMEECARGVLDELNTSGILKKFNIVVERKNAQNEFTLGQSIAQDIVRRKYDYIISLSTPALQIMAQANKKIPHVFGAVTDPYRMGVAKSSTEHLPQLTGVATFQPVEEYFKIMRELLPHATRVGIIWNPSEACSEACTIKARAAAQQYGFELIEANVTSTTEVMDALHSILDRRIDIFLTSGDNTVLMAVESIAEVLRKYKIPYFGNSPSDIERGCLIAVGADYYEVGRAVAKVMEKVIAGTPPKNIPIQDCVPIQIGLNLPLAKEFGLNLPESFLKRVAIIRR
jgi:putative ABC transport system permease protein